MSPSGWRGRGWGPPGSRGRGRPPWWPEGQPWPPAGGPPPRPGGRRLLWRNARFIAPPLLLIAGGVTSGGGVAGTPRGPLQAPPPGPVLALSPPRGAFVRIL